MDKGFLGSKADARRAHLHMGRGTAIANTATAN